MNNGMSMSMYSMSNMPYPGNSLPERNPIMGLQMDIQLSNEQQELMRTQAKQIEGAIALLQRQHEAITRALMSSQKTLSNTSMIGCQAASVDEIKLQSQSSFKVQFALPITPSLSYETSQAFPQPQISNGISAIASLDQSAIQSSGRRISLSSAHPGYDFRTSSLPTPSPDPQAHQPLHNHTPSSHYFQRMSSGPGHSKLAPDGHGGSSSSLDSCAPSERKRHLDRDTDSAEQSAAKGRCLPTVGKLVLDAEVAARFPGAREACSAERARKAHESARKYQRTPPDSTFASPLFKLCLPPPPLFLLRPPARQGQATRPAPPPLQRAP